MPKGLRRWHGGGEQHFITCSCYRRQPFLGSARRRDVFLRILEEVRHRFDFVVWGYVVMPEHFHLSVSEPRKRSLSLAMQVLKQRVSRRCRRTGTSTHQIALWENEVSPAFWDGWPTLSRFFLSSRRWRVPHPSSEALSGFSRFGGRVG